MIRALLCSLPSEPVVVTWEASSCCPALCKWPSGRSVPCLPALSAVCPLMACTSLFPGVGPLLPLPWFGGEATSFLKTELNPP